MKIPRKKCIKFKNLRSEKVYFKIYFIKDYRLSVQALSSLMDKRLYRCRQLLWKIKSKKDVQEIEEHINLYREVVFEWNDNLNRNLVLTQRYFGVSTKRDLE